MLDSTRRWWFIAVAVCVAVAGAMLLAVLVLQRPTPPIVRATASPSPSDLPESPSPTAEPTAAPPATLDLEWTETAAFGDNDGGVLEVNDAAEWAHGMIAVGTRYDRPIPQSGFLPLHGGRVWLSADGRAWEDATPRHAFIGMHLHEVFEAGDGSLIVIGELDSGLDPWAHFWRSTDGRIWEPISSGLPVRTILRGAEHGPLGYLLFGFVAGEGPRPALLWFSADGLAWELVRTGSTGSARDQSREFFAGIRAGIHGFAAFGFAAQGSSQTSFTVASTNGRDWGPAPNPPDAFVLHVARVGEGWIAIGVGPPGRGPVMTDDLPETTVWTSTNAFDWPQVGTLTFGTVDLDVQVVCSESMNNLQTAGDWLVLSMTVGCVSHEESVEGYGAPRISLDGTDWHPLPFPGFSLDPTTLEPVDEGSIVRAAIASELGLVLAGQSNGQATFWLGVPR